MEKPSRSHDPGIMTDAHNHNTSKNSLGNELQHWAPSHGAKAASIFHRRHQVTSALALITKFMVNLRGLLWMGTSSIRTTRAHESIITHEKTGVL